jgi:D-ribose pyranase
MKCKGVIHPELMEALTSLGHTDSFMLCDAGFPIPAGAQRIDLALTLGVPSFRICLNAILQEVIVEAFSVAEEMKTYNPETFEYLMALLPRQQRAVAPQSEFLVQAQSRARFFVRSGELKPYSNILLTAASGVERFHKDFIVDPALLTKD